VSAAVQLDPGPEGELDRLEKTGQWVLLERIEDALDALAEDPGSRDSRKRAFKGGTFGITIRESDDNWLIVWEHDADEEGVVVVRYIGLDPFA
jgi:hypothetical protein